MHFLRRPYHELYPLKHQWMAVGASGRHGNHAVWRVEWDARHVLAHALIQRQKGTERIALGQISTQRAAICLSVQVDVCFEILSLKLFWLFWCSSMFLAYNFGIEIRIWLLRCFIILPIWHGILLALSRLDNATHRINRYPADKC